MKVSTTSSVSVPFRLDPMSKAKMEWVKAHFQDIKPTGSMIIRRALSIYLRHLEASLGDPEQFEPELLMLKSSASGDLTPWKTPPDFAGTPGKPFSLWITEAYKRRVEGFLKSDPFGHMAHQKGVRTK